jgi:hypothetical protein
VSLYRARRGLGDHATTDDGRDLTELDMLVTRTNHGAPIGSGH